MMIKANGEYLDFNGDIEISSQIKLFEEIETSNGDYSYDIEVQDNGHNRKILGIPRADVIKSIYRAVPSEVIDDTGQSIYTGKLQVNRIEGGVISSTFFSGNTEWFAMLSDPLSSLPLYRYDVELTLANIQASWAQNTGIVFPILDAGALVTRSFANLKIEDFTACVYVKTLFNEIFNPKGIKVEGDLLSDAIFKKLTTASNGRSQDDVTDRSCYVNKTTAQNNINSLTKITFQDESLFPFFDGETGNFSSSTYTADVKMIGDLQVTLVLGVVDTFPVPFSGFVYVYVNGASVKKYVILGFNGQPDTFSFDYSIRLEAGDTVEIYTDLNTGDPFDVRVNSTFKFTPTYIYKVFGQSSVPNWTQGEYVSNILRLFNVLPSYNVNTKTLTLDLFNKIKEKEYIDVSDQIVVDTTDFTDFVSNYAKNNMFSYQESTDEDLRKYNISNFIKYGSGNLTIDNDYLENSAPVVESDFTSPITYLNGAFDVSMERFNFVFMDEIFDRSILSVIDDSGYASFEVNNASTYFTAGDLVRIDTDLNEYDGEWVVAAVSANHLRVNTIGFTSSASGTITLLRHAFTTDDNVYLFVNVQDVATNFFSAKSVMLLENTEFSTSALAYFNLLNNNTPINKVYKQSLSFGAPNNPLNYQIPLLDTYWSLFSRILNDPVMLLATGTFKRKTYDEIKSFLRPLIIKTEETVNLYYLNRLVGYNGSERGCDSQLIKLN